MVTRVRSVGDGGGDVPPANVTTIRLDARSLWRGAWLVVAVVGIVAFLRFFFADAGSFVYLIILSFFFAAAIEPVVARLSRRMPRGLASGVVLILVLVGVVGFFALFGGMLTEQVTALVKATPDAAQSVVDWVNQRFGTSYQLDTILSDVGLTTEKITGYATSIAKDLLTIVGGLASSALNVFGFAFFTYYLSAGLPRLRQWIAGLVRPDHQVVFLTVWETMLVKVGGYVGARMILAAINGTVLGLFMLVIGMDYWLPLALWTGIVAQFVPNIGTYIAIALPVLVGLVSSDPRDGLLVLAAAIAYQQVENIFIEPRISARAVDVHPAVSFASALVGAQLFGLSGALLGVPVAATVMAVFEMYKHRYDVTDETEQQVVEQIQSAARRRGEEPPSDEEIMPEVGDEEKDTTGV